MTRALRLSVYYIKQEQYPTLRRFYERVLSGDGQQAALRHAENAEAK